jgi:hypothetical protein
MTWRARGCGEVICSCVHPDAPKTQVSPNTAIASFVVRDSPPNITTPTPGMYAIA